MSTPAPRAVHIIGTGLIGTSIGLALRRSDIAVTLEDRDADVLGAAIERGAGTAADEATAPDLVVVAVPPGSVGEAMAAAAGRWTQATVTDVASVKARPLATALGAGADPTRLVGGHPMAGRETTGPAGARADLFEDRAWVVTPTPEASPASRARVAGLVEACGAVPVVMAPEDHDAAVAVTSHLPQLLASALAARLLAVSDDAVRVSGQGLADMTRIADSDADLWTAILEANADPVGRVLDALIGDLVGWREALRAEPMAAEEVRAALARGAEGRDRVPGKHGARQAQYAVVPVLVRDEPGELARLVVATGDLGVNLEDIRIEHVLGRPSGLIELSVREDVGPTLVEGLRSRGFDVRA